MDLTTPAFKPICYDGPTPSAFGYLNWDPLAVGQFVGETKGFCWFGGDTWCGACMDAGNVPAPCTEGPDPDCLDLCCLNVTGVAYGGAVQFLTEAQKGCNFLAGAISAELYVIIIYEPDIDGSLSRYRRVYGLHEWVSMA